MPHSPLSMTARNVFALAPEAPRPAARLLRAAFAQGRALTPVQQHLLWFAAFTAATGLFHLVVWLVQGMPSLVGPVTWRKPIVFGLSIGVLFASLTWIAAFLPADRRMLRSTRLLLALVTVELGLIDMQQWRGVPSHFNHATTFDYWVFQAMGSIIIAAAIIVAHWAWRLTRADARTTPAAIDKPEQLHAARAAMLLLASGNVIGLMLAATGSAFATKTGTLPTPVGTFGDFKHAHAVALHALQVLPLASIAIGWFTRRRVAAKAKASANANASANVSANARTDAAAASRRALALMRLTTVAYVGLLLFTLTRTMAGDSIATIVSMAIMSPLASVIVVGSVVAAASGSSGAHSRSPSIASAHTNAARSEQQRADPRAVRFVMALDEDLRALERGGATARADSGDGGESPGPGEPRGHAVAHPSTDAVRTEMVH